METKRFQIYKCPVCDTVVEVLHQWSLELVCCGPAMVPVRAKTKQEGWEDHTPAIEEVEGGYRISVGESPHPMTKAHRIEWIEVVAEGRSHRQFLSPGQAAEAVFAAKSPDAVIRLYCTAHGMWQSTLAKGLRAACLHDADQTAELICS
jgi:superoxide reductase